MHHEFTDGFPGQVSGESVPIRLELKQKQCTLGKQIGAKEESEAF